MNIRNLKIFGAVTAVIGVPIVLTSLVINIGRAKCEVKGYHSHKYINTKNKIVRYIDSEWKNIQGYERKENYVEIDESQKDLMKFEKDNKLAKIEDNLELIQEKINSNKDFIEFRYKYYHRYRVRKRYHTSTRYTWSENPPVNTETGEERLCHNVYQGYKIEKNEKGKYVLIPSGYVDNLLDIKDEYPYIKENFNIVIDASTGKKVSYENGAPTESDIRRTENKIQYTKK